MTHDSVAQCFAALDLGSNSFHLLTARAHDGALQPLLKLKQTVHLAAGLDKQQRLNETAMQRALDALQICAQRLQGFTPDHVRVVATHSLRQATNADAFIQRARQVLKYPIEIVSGHEEARLIYLGVAQTHANDAPRMVIDIGGGSTELIIGEGFSPRFMTSRSMGAGSFTEAYFKSGKLTAKRFQKAVVAAQVELEQELSQLLRQRWQTVLGTSGSIRAMATQARSLLAGPTDELSRADLEALKGWLLQAGHTQALTQVVIAPERAEQLAAGVAILTAIFDELQLTSLQLSDAALREGVLYELAEAHFARQDIRSRTIDSMVKRYAIDTEQASRVQDTAQQLFAQAQQAWSAYLQGPCLDLSPTAWSELLDWAARLHEIGLHIHSSGKHKHGAYILQHIDMPGFNREQQQALAVLVRLQRKKIRLELIPTLSLYPREGLLRVIALLRLALLLNQDRQSQAALAHTLVTDNSIRLTLKPEFADDAVLIADLIDEARQVQKLGLQLDWWVNQNQAGKP